MSPGTLAALLSPVRSGRSGDRSPFSVRLMLCRAGSLADHAGVAESLSPTADRAIVTAKPRLAAIKEWLHMLISPILERQREKEE